MRTVLRLYVGIPLQEHDIYNPYAHQTCIKRKPRLDKMVLPNIGLLEEEMLARYPEYSQTLNDLPSLDCEIVVHY